jgi:hypothetical protein
MFAAVAVVRVVVGAGVLALLLSLAPGAFVMALMVAATVALAAVVALIRRMPPEDRREPPSSAEGRPATAGRRYPARSAGAGSTRIHSARVTTSLRSKSKTPEPSSGTTSQTEPHRGQIQVACAFGCSSFGGAHVCIGHPPLGITRV